jgi:3-oxoacyl-[acyl-carrier protein] reductase
MKTALVTGATEGIGRATALALGKAGYRVGVVSRTESKIRQLVAHLKEEGIEAAGAAADVGQPEPVKRAVGQLTGGLGEIDVLVNNAGVLIAKPFEELTLDDWDSTMAVNVRSLYLMCRAVLPAMRRRQQGTIVNVASLAGRNGFAGGTAYSASKHAVVPHPPTGGCSRYYRTRPAPPGACPGERAGRPADESVRKVGNVGT